MTKITTGPDGEALFDGVSIHNIIANADDLSALWNDVDGDISNVFALAAAALRHLSAQNEWQPIEAAPMDGLFLYIMDNGEICLHKEDDYTEWRAYPGPAGISGVSRPTHWRPLPAPPGGEK